MEDKIYNFDNLEQYNEDDIVSSFCRLPDGYFDFAAFRLDKLEDKKKENEFRVVHVIYGSDKFRSTLINSINWALIIVSLGS